MSQSKKLYKVLKKDKLVTTLLPGRYAGWKVEKIFGRLDCKSGMRIKKENRVFFASWKDAVDAGYRPCKNCKPQDSDKYPDQETLREDLLTTLHIGLWKSGPPPNRPESIRIWYVRLDWKEKTRDKIKNHKIILSDSFAYQTARGIAIALGKRCNLVVTQHSSADFKVIGIPVERTNEVDAARDRKNLRELRKAKKITVPTWLL